MVLVQENEVCKLKKSFYSLKQAPKYWYKKFDGIVVQNDFVVNTFDSCVYSKLVHSDCEIIYLDVDDTLIFGNNVLVAKKSRLSILK